MKALVKKFPQKGLWLEDVEEPTVGVNDVKIKIHKTAICGTDLHIYNWDEWAVPVCWNRQYRKFCRGVSNNLHSC